MGFLSWMVGRGKKKNNIKAENNENQIDVITKTDNDKKKETQLPNIKKREKKVYKFNSYKERIEFVKENCEGIIESLRQNEEAKMEYQAVTSYLSDMQRIDMIPLDQKVTLEDAARKIINLNKERSKLQKKDSKITEQQYRLFERYDMQIAKELPNIKEKEEYQILIQSDMKHLEKEKKAIINEQADINNKLGFLKGITITTCIIIIILFCIFGALTLYQDANLTIPFILTLVMGMLSVLYIFTEIKKNKHDNKVIDLKLNKVIMLMNKVKLKAVNNRNYLDYAYNKYNISSYEEMKTFWEEYVAIKDEERRYKNNTELLEFYNRELIQELKNYGIADAEVWIYQPSAILDNKEMVEVRHRLNVRRQKLRERIELNTKQKEEAISAIKTVIKEYPDCEEEANHIVRRYRIEL